MISYNPRIDFAFKKLFGSEKNSDILLALINSILEPENRITSLKLLNPYRQGAVPSDKGIVLDVCAHDGRGQQYNIEMQIAGDAAYDKRALYYWSRFYNTQLKKGESFSQLKRTISIHILNFDYFQEEAGYHHIFRLMHTRSKQSYFKDLELHFIELERFKKTNPEILTALDRWAAFLSHAQEYDRKKLPKHVTQDPHIMRAFEALETLSLNEEEQTLYEARQKWFWDEALILQSAREKAMEQGLKQGIKIGMEQAEEKMIKRLETQGKNPQEIADILGFDLNV